MESIRELFKIGVGPSSSHTMGPAKAAEYILDNYKDIKSIKITLYGSLARTGKGHLTDYIISLKFKDIKHEVLFDEKTETNHPNTMIFEIETKDGVFKEEILSLGGGTILTKDNADEIKADVYPHKTLKEILEYCSKNSLSLSEYVKKYEDADIVDYLKI